MREWPGPVTAKAISSKESGKKTCEINLQKSRVDLKLVGIPHPLIVFPEAGLTLPQGPLWRTANKQTNVDANGRAPSGRQGSQRN